MCRQARLKKKSLQGIRLIRCSEHICSAHLTVHWVVRLTTQCVIYTRGADLLVESASFPSTHTHSPTRLAKLPGLAGHPLEAVQCGSIGVWR